jgi:amidase
VDVVLLPAVARGPIGAGSYDGTGYLRTYLMAARSTPYCQAWNLAGTPAVVLPIGEADGMPRAVQLAGPAGSEARLLALADRLETEH